MANCRVLTAQLYTPQIATAKPFCDGTVCPFSFASAFVTGAQLQLADCQNGDRSQLFAAFTLPTSKAPEPRQNLIPLTWAVSAYTGNGKIGARVQSEEGGVGVLHVLIDNVELGAYGKRKPTGCFPFLFLSLRVQASFLGCAVLSNNAFECM